jgi:flagellar basal body-associated protein FliL
MVDDSLFLATIIVVIVIVLAQVLVLIWVFWPKRAQNRIGSYGTNSESGTSEPSYYTETNTSIDNPVSAGASSYLSTRVRESEDFDRNYNETNYTEVPKLDDDWLT